MITRSFKIFNSRGDMIDFLSNLNIFAISPEGLGVSFDSNYYESNANFLLENNSVEIGQFKIQVIFGALDKDPYGRYDELIALLNYPPYTLEYATSVGTWNRKCRLNEVTKTEINSLNVMSEELVLDLITPWYTEVTTESEVQEPQDGDGKIYADILDPKEDASVFFNTPPINGYKKGDIWFYDPSQTWEGKNLYTGKTGLITKPTTTYFEANDMAVQLSGDISSPFTISLRTDIKEVSVITGAAITEFMAIQWGLQGPAGTYAYNIINSHINIPIDNSMKGTLLSNTFVIDSVYDLSNGLSSRLSRSTSLISASVEYYDIMLVRGTEAKEFRPNPYSILGATSGFLIATKNSDTLDIFDFEKYTPTPALNPSVFLETPDRYGVGDLYQYEYGDTWDGINLVNQMVTGVFTPGKFVLDSRQTSGVADITYGKPAPGYCRISTKVGSGNSFYAAGTYTNAKVMPNWMLNHMLGKTAKGSVRANIWGVSKTIPVHPFTLSAYVWTSASTTPFKLTEVVLKSNFETTEIEFEVPMACTNIMLAVRSNGPVTADGQTIVDFTDMFLGISGNTFQLNPIDMAKSEMVKLVSSGPNYNFDLRQWGIFNGKIPESTVELTYPMTYDYIYGVELVPPKIINFAYTYDYIYEGWDSGQNGVFLLQNQSRYLSEVKGSPLEITIKGPSSNPSWSIVVNNKVVQTDGFNLEIPVGYTLVVSSVPQDQKAILIAPNGDVSNVYQQQRLELTNFVTAPPGDSIITFANAKEVKFIFREERVVV